MSRLSSQPEPFRKLTPAQRRVFEAVRRLTAWGGLPPILQEIADYMGLRRWTIHSHLVHLKAARLVDWDPHTPRSLTVTTDPDLLALHGFEPSPYRRPAKPPEPGGMVWELPEQPTTKLPVLGPAAAGPFITANADRDQDGQDIIELPPEFAGTAQYAVRIKGKSMEGRRLFDGDLALVDQRQTVREDDVVAVIAEDEQTDDMKANVKIFGRRDGVALLLSANPAYPAIPAEGTRILGRVTAVIRHL
jgi:SOS-response transcriptional repressor LexA